MPDRNTRGDDRALAERIANICGGSSAASLAIAEADRRKAASEHVGIWRTPTSWIVLPIQEDHADA